MSTLVTSNVPIASTESLSHSEFQACPVWNPRRRTSAQSTVKAKHYLARSSWFVPSAAIGLAGLLGGPFATATLLGWNAIRRYGQAGMGLTAIAFGAACLLLASFVGAGAYLSNVPADLGHGATVLFGGSLVLISYVSWASGFLAFRETSGMGRPVDRDSQSWLLVIPAVILGWVLSGGFIVGLVSLIPAMMVG